MLQNSPVTTRLMALDDARASGARALFGEKYGDEVRVVAMGEGGGNTLGWSVELCGGTHVRRTGDIGLISGVTDAGVAAGVRRIEALTGKAARKAANHDDRSSPRAPRPRSRRRSTRCRRGSRALIDERRKLERELTDAKKKLAMGGGAKAGGEANGVRMVGDVKLMARAVSGIDIKDLKSLADEGKKQLGSGVVALVGVTEEGKAGIVVGVTSDLTARFNAVDLVREGRRGARRQGRRRAARHGAGRRSGRRQGRCGARRDRGRARRMMRTAHSPSRRFDRCRARRRAARAGARRVPRSADRSALERAEGNASPISPRGLRPKPASSSRPTAG